MLFVFVLGKNLRSGMAAFALFAVFGGVCKMNADTSGIIYNTDGLGQEIWKRDRYRMFQLLIFDIENKSLKATYLNFPSFFYANYSKIFDLRKIFIFVSYSKK